MQESEALAPTLSKWMYDVDDPNKLNDEQKSTLSAILSLGSSALGATLGGHTTDAIASSMASSVAVEDNRQLKQENKLHQSTC